MTHQQNIKIQNLEATLKALFKRRDAEVDPWKRELIEDEIEAVQAEIERIKEGRVK